MKGIAPYLIFVALVFLPGCNLGPKPCIPEMDIPSNWHAETACIEQSSHLNHSDPLSLGQLFDDELLKHYLACIAMQNYDARIAAAKVCEAFALRKVSYAKIFPWFDQRVAYYSSNPAGGTLSSSDPNSQGGGLFGGIPLNLKESNFIADFDALWEIDLFGKRRKEVESASAFTCMQTASYHSVLLSLMAEFARNYLELRRAQKTLRITKQQIALLEEKTAITENRLIHGLDTSQQLLDSEVSTQQLLAQVPPLEAEILSLMYHLSFLLGKPPESLVDALAEEKNIPGMQAIVPIGFPSELLRRRPDIWYAEYQISKTTADLGSAIADLFPKLTLTGNFGFQSLSLGKMSGSGQSWGYGVNLITPLFHMGSIRGNIQKNQWIQEQAFLSYEQTVIQALEEAESSIATFLKTKVAEEKKKNAYIFDEQLMIHIEKQYQQGLVNRLNLVESKLSSLQREIDWVQAAIDSEIQLVALYKALGGSWQ